MAVMIPEPIDNNPMTEDWQKLLFKLTATAGGFHIIDIDNNENAPPAIAAGSRLEINGSFYAVLSPDDLHEYHSLQHGFFWIYAQPNNETLGGNTASFYCTKLEPNWDVHKGGWFFTENKRAVAYCYKNNAGKLYSWVPITGKVIAYDRCAPDINDPLPDTPVFSRTVKGEWFTPLPKGWYAVDMSSGGGGGNGGRGGDGAGAVGGGGVANQFNRIVRAFFHEGESPLFVKVGGSGFNGGSGASGGSGSGNNGGSGGGGGSGSGEETSCGDIRTGIVRNGSGGDGGTGSGGGTSGGAGASGAGRNGLNGSAGSAGAAQGPANGGNGANQGNWGAGGGGGGAGGINGVGSNGGAGGTTTGTGNRGGGGGGGGGAGSTRLPGAAAAGFCNIFALSN